MNCSSSRPSDMVGPHSNEDKRDLKPLLSFMTSTCHSLRHVSQYDYDDRVFRKNKTSNYFNNITTDFKSPLNISTMFNSTALSTISTKAFNNICMVLLLMFTASFASGQTVIVNNGCGVDKAIQTHVNGVNGTGIALSLIHI